MENPVSNGTLMAGIEIVVVEGSSELKDFIDLPWNLYAEYPRGVPPLKKEVRRLLDPRRHPFWSSAERRLFLARRGSQAVGRIAGIIDRRYNEFHGEQMGIWGFFECADDPAAAAALFSAVETWARRKGMAFVRGPLNPSTNYEVGLLVEGFDYPPALMMTYNPPYYSRLVELCGFSKEKDLFAFLSDGGMRDIQKGVITCADPGLAFFIYYEDKPAAVCVIFPDISPMLKRPNA